MDLHKGSCFCGEVDYRLNAEIKRVVNCHCHFCRSHSGAAFSTFVVVPFDSLEIAKGKEIISAFQFENGKKHFCGACGTPIFNVNKKYPGLCMIYLGTLEKAGDITPVVNIWCESKLGWVDTLSSIHSLALGPEKK